MVNVANFINMPSMGLLTYVTDFLIVLNLLIRYSKYEGALYNSTSWRGAIDDATSGNV